MLQRLRKGQSTLEYVLVFAAIVLGIIAGTHLVQRSTEKGYKDATNAMERSTTRFGQMIGGI
jgi:uncharacterized protein (UPF0333 family)